MTLPAIAVGGPEAGAGISRGDWEFAHTGALVVAEEVLKGRDLVILATPTEPFANSFVMTRKEITNLAQLAGKKVGVLTETGQTSVTARLTIEKAGATATYVPLVKFDRIFAALAAGQIDAGALPIDLRFSGEAHYGWNAFPLNEFGTPSVFATSRRLITADRNLVMDVMRGFVETIHLFKTHPATVVPMLQRYLGIDDPKAAKDLYTFHASVFRKVPSPLLTGMPKLREFLAKTYPAADELKEADIADPSFIDELEGSGFINKLYTE
jgi:ABC-type nitrate/sulfonate/bicarbonate transport system substrate-binding protein